jgi:hypothetical protein
VRVQYLSADPQDRDLVVDAIACIGDEILYYICEDIDVYPIPRSAALFSIIDGSLSRHWVFKASKLITDFWIGNFGSVIHRPENWWDYMEIPEHNQRQRELEKLAGNTRAGFIMAFREWSESPYFYDRLTDGESTARNLFAEYRKKFDVEFPCKTIRNQAIHIAGRTLLCPDCNQTWNAISELDALVQCEACAVLYNNPIWKHEQLAMRRFHRPGRDSGSGAGGPPG